MIFCDLQKLFQTSLPLSVLHISSVSCAQMVFFYIFGITPSFDGSVTIYPVKNRPAENMTVENARLCGKTFSVSVGSDSFTVRFGKKELTEKIGNSITI